MSDNSPGLRGRREQPRVQRGLPEVIDKEQYLLSLQEEFPDLFPEGGDLRDQRIDLAAKFRDDYFNSIADYYGLDMASDRAAVMERSRDFQPVWENEAQRQAEMQVHGESHDGSTAETYRLPPDSVPVMDAHRRWEFMHRLLDPEVELTASDVDIGMNGGGEYWRRGNIPMNWFPGQRRKVLPTSNGPAYFDAQEKSSAMGEAAMAGRGDTTSAILNTMEPAFGVSAYRESMAGNADTMGRNIGQTYNENVVKQGAGGVKTSQLPVFQSDGNPTTRIQQLLAQQKSDRHHNENYQGIDPEQHMTPFADTYGLSDKTVEEWAPTFDRAADYLDLSLLATIPFGYGAAAAAAKTAAKSFKPIAAGSKYWMPGSLSNIRRLATTFNEAGTEVLQNEGLAAGLSASMGGGEPEHWDGRKEGESRQSWHARNAIDRANTIQSDYEADQKNPPVEVRHVRDAVLRGGEGLPNLIRQNKHLQSEAMEEARRRQGEEKAKYTENSRADTGLPM